MPDTRVHGPWLVLAFSALAALIIWITTINGAGLQPDSIHYIRMARGLGSGESVFAISKHWPPGYPLLLAIFSGEVGAELGPARWITMVSYVVAVAGFGACLTRAVSGHYARYLVAAVMLAVILSPVFTRAAWYALTEGPFFAALMWGLYATLILADRPSPWALVLLCICIAVMTLLRYSAAPFVLALLLVLVHAAIHWSWRRRLTVLAAFVLGLLPLSTWMLLHEVEGNPRHYAYHPVTEEHIIQFLDTMGGWLGGLPGLLTCALLVLTLMAGAVCWWRHRSPALLFCLLIIPGYLAFLLLSISFLDAHTPLDGRILSPLGPFWLLLMAISLPAFASADHRKMAELGVVAVFVALTALRAPSFARHADKPIRYGAVFADRRAAVQPVILYAAQIPEEQTIYTNYSEWLYLLYNRETRMLPNLFSPHDMTVNPDLVADMTAMIRELVETDGVVVWVDFIKGRRYLPDVRYLTEQLPLEIVEEPVGGKILKVRAGVRLPPEESGSAAR